MPRMVHIKANTVNIAPESRLIWVHDRSGSRFFSDRTAYLALVDILIRLRRRIKKSFRAQFLYLRGHIEGE